MNMNVGPLSRVEQKKAEYGGMILTYLVIDSVSERLLFSKIFVSIGRTNEEKT